MLLPLQKMMAEAANISFDPSPAVAAAAGQRLKSPFKLPIAYVAPKHLHVLSDVVVQDLELAQGKERSMYEVLFKPTHVFGKEMIQQWKRHYSSDPEYLRKTQAVIQQVSDYPETPVDAQAMREIWRETKESASDYFLEKYCFVEWDWLKFLNKSPAVLQILSVANMMSPVISLVMPFLFLLFPFLILKLRGIPITFSVYRDVLQDIARNHFIGKALTNLASLSIEKLMYFFIMTGLYFWQIYQNILMCQRFHKNMFRVNEHLLAVRTYAKHCIEDMREFVGVVNAGPATVTALDEEQQKPYTMFCQDVRKHVAYLENMVADLESVTPMTTIAAKVGSIGYLLQRYYELHTNPFYEQGLHYSFGFQGFLDNLRGVKCHLVSRTVNKAQIVVVHQGGTRFYEQVYPLLSATKGKGSELGGGGVGNDCRLDKNMIITGPNASGKTTYLKTTSINVIFTQQIGCGFYTKGVLNPYTHIHSYLNIPDTSERDSLFQAESRRCKEILDAIAKSSKGDTAASLPMQSSSRHFCIFDELYSGTNPVEAGQAGYAFLKYLNEFDNVDFVLTTHYVSMCKRFKKVSKVRNYKMDVTENEDGSLTYKYQIKTGISKIQGAIRVLEAMGYPWEILDTIKNKK